jgi:DNA-directed RNA polymerase N-terminal
LGQLILTCSVLPEDVFTREKLLEDSLYEVATKRLKHQAEISEELGIGDDHLNNSHLQRWMWDWHQKLQKRLKSEVADIIKAEEAICEVSSFLPLCLPSKDSHLGFTSKQFSQSSLDTETGYGCNLDRTTPSTKRYTNSASLYHEFHTLISLPHYVVRLGVRTTLLMEVKIIGCLTI